MTGTERNHGATIPRYLAIVLAAVLGLSLFPTAALASHNPDGDNPCDGAPTADQFTDRNEARATHRESIDCALWRALTQGTTASTYSPLDPVRRDSMASFVVNTLVAAGYDDELPAGDGPNEFDDIDGNTHAGNINRLQRAGIVRGVTDVSYAPGRQIKRDQMASFMVQAADWAVGTEDDGSRVDDHPVDGDGVNRFTDVPASNPHKGNIENGADTSPPLFRGETPATFAPGKNVLRDQMATFLINLLNYIFGEDAPDPDLATLVSATFGDTDDSNSITAADTLTLTFSDPVELSTSVTLEGANGNQIVLTDEPDPAADPEHVDSDFAVSADGLTVTITINETPATVLTDPITIVACDGIVDAESGEPVDCSGDVSFNAGDDTPLPNQDFPVTPADEAINQASGTPGSATGDRGLRSYSANVGSEAVDIALIPTANVTIDENGLVTFADPDVNDRADGIGETAARIESVNGVSRTTNDGNDYVNNASAQGGNITLTVNSQNVNHSVIPVVFVDANNNDQLDLDADNRPTELFGIGGPKTYMPPEAGFGTFNGVEVVLARQDADLFSTTGGTPPGDRHFAYDDNDQYRYTSGIAGTAQIITMEQFETFLSGRSTRDPNVGGLGNVMGDILNVNYNPDGSSTFTITRDVPAAVSGLTATATDTDNDGVNDDVQLMWTAPPNPDVWGYRVFRAPVVNGTVGTYMQVNLAPDDNNAKSETTYNDQGRDAGTFSYIVVAFNDHDNDGNPDDAGPNSAPVQATVAESAVAAPWSVDSTFADTKTGGTNPPNDVLDAGDRITFTYDKSIQLGNNPSAVIRDEDGDAVRLTHGTNATFSVGGGNNRQLIIDVTGPPTLVAAGTGPGANSQIDTNDLSAIESSTGVQSTGGGEWNLPESGRVSFGTPPGPRTRVWAGDNDDLPTALQIGDVTFNTANDTVRIEPGADNIDDGETFRVFNSQGVEIASATYNATTGTTVTTSQDLAPGGTFYVVYTDSEDTTAGGPPNERGTSLPSETLRVDIAGEAPTVTSVSGTGNMINVNWTEVVEMAPGATPSDFQVFNATNSVLVATGTAVSGEGTSTLTVTLDNALANNTEYNLRVAAATVHDNDDNPNPAQTVPFTTSANFDINVDRPAGAFPTETTEDQTDGTPDDTVEVTLTQQPFGPVEVSVTSADTTEVTVSPNTLTFTQGNWNVPQTVNLQGVDDAVADGDITSAINLTTNDTATSDEYDAASATFDNINTDDDTAGPTVMEVRTVPGSDALDVEFNEDVNCRPGDVDTANSFDYDDQEPTAATADEGVDNTGSPTTIAQQGTDTCRLTGGDFAGIDIGDFGELDFTNSASPVGSRIISSTSGNEAVNFTNEDVIDTAAPNLIDVIEEGTDPDGATTDCTANDRLLVVFSEEIDLSTVDADDFNILVNNTDGIAEVDSRTGESGTDDAEFCLVLDTTLTAGQTVTVQIVDDADDNLQDASNDNIVPIGQQESDVAN